MSQRLWPQIVHYAIERRGTQDAGRKLALALYKKMTGQWPTKDFYNTTPEAIQPDVANKIRSMNIAYARARAKERMALPAQEEAAA